uniref:Uncharacterized protein n=1 Tax=Streptomyces citricolor TaxID=212427 RepID=A0A7R6FIW8_9ACTN|nr:hypothetical protein [Streptomyces citricolor]
MPLVPGLAAVGGGGLGGVARFRVPRPLAVRVGPLVPARHGMLPSAADADSGRLSAPRWPASRTVEAPGTRFKNACLRRSAENRALPLIIGCARIRRRPPPG